MRSFNKDLFKQIAAGKYLGAGTTECIKAQEEYYNAVATGNFVFKASESGELILITLAELEHNMNVACGVSYKLCSHGLQNEDGSLQFTDGPCNSKEQGIPSVKS